MNELPNNPEAERAVLGSIFLNADAIVALAPWFAADFFYQEKHRLIYQAMLVCYQKRGMPSIRLVSDQLGGDLETVGGFAYLLRLDDGLPHGLDAEFYARRVEQCAVERGLLKAAGAIARITSQGLPADEALAGAQAELAKVASLRSSSVAFVPFSAIVDEVYDDLAADASPGIATGFRDLDEVTGGFHPGNLVILAARTSVGKTSFAGCLACNIADIHKRPVAVVSLEMGRKEILTRAAAFHAGLDLAAIRDRRVSDEERQEFLTALSWAHDQPVYVNDEPRQTMAKIRANVLRLQVEHGTPALIVLDYIQLMRGDGKKERYREIGEFTSELKMLAREVGAPVLALSQLSRKVEERASKVPMLSDLRESGDLEQDADIVMFIYRPELYSDDPEKKGVAELHIAKHRNGSLGMVPLRFDAKSTRFDTLSYRQPEGY